ncbi:MAG: DNA repair protein RecO, partial [Pyrinomonadaceae bacterium]
MSLIETESIVLKTHNLADADKIVVLLTHDHGVVRGVAKGVKRLKSRFGSGLEPFSIVRATYFEKEAVELVSIQNIDLVESFFAAASNPDFLQKFSYLSDLLITFSPPNDPNENLYRMVRASIKAAAEDVASYLAISVYFESWILRLAGFMPDWDHCDQCRRVIEDSETAEVRSNFHLICSVCRRPTGSRV